MKKVLICLLILISSLAFIGCEKDKSASTPQKAITIGLMPDVASVPFIIAEKNGYFTKEGVQVKIEYFSSAKDRDSALQSGKLDGVVTDILAVVFANEGGINLRMISRSDGNIQLMAGKNSGINSITDLKGKSLGLSTNTIMEYTADRMIEAGQLKPEEVKKTAIPQLPTRLEMLQSGKIDAAILCEPLSGMAIKNGAKVLNSTDAIGSKAGVTAFTAKSLQENSKEIKAVFKAYNDAVEYLNKEPKSSYIDYVIQSLAFPLEMKNSIQLPQYTKAELPSEKVFTDVLKWLKDKNLIKGNYEYKSLIDDTVLR